MLAKDTKPEEENPRKNRWIKTALIDAGYEQKDLARAWGCDSAVVSRFINEGRPRLTTTRAKILADMLGITREELLTRVEGGTAPRSGVVARQAAKRSLPAAPAAPPPAQTLQDAMEAMRAAVERVKALLPPGLRIVWAIEPDSGTTKPQHQMGGEVFTG